MGIETGNTGGLRPHHGLDQCQGSMFLDIGEIAGVEGVQITQHTRIAPW
jgi:hypothetical protein